MTTVAVDATSSTGEVTTTEPDVPSAVAETSSGQTTTTVATMGIPYTVDSGRKLDVYTPGGQGPWPVVVVVHGFAQGKFSFAPLAEAIASEGAVVFNIGVETSFPFRTAIDEVACAVRFSRATAAGYGGDDTRITLVGNSLGATLGAIVAMAGDDFAGDCVVTEGSAVVDALVGYEGGYDHATHNYGQVPEDGNLPALREEDPELWATVNPYSHIGGNPDLVVRLIHGDDTDAAWYEIPRQISVEFHQALAEAGYDAEVTLLDGPSHIGLTLPSSKAFEVAVQQALQVAGG
jgi:acetyl esterase/lipase